MNRWAAKDSFSPESTKKCSSSSASTLSELWAAVSIASWIPRHPASSLCVYPTANNTWGVERTLQKGYYPIYTRDAEWTLQEKDSPNSEFSKSYTYFKPSQVPWQCDAVAA